MTRRPTRAGSGQSDQGSMKLRIYKVISGRGKTLASRIIGASTVARKSRRRTSCQKRLWEEQLNTAVSELGRPHA
jgi:hypothetical protein